VSEDIKMTHTTGVPTWLALSSTDPERSINFYRNLLGWEVERSGPEFENNVNFRLDGKLVASMSGHPSDVGSAWGVFLHTDDAAETALAAIASGGAELFQSRIGDIGTMVVLTDASGATVGAWQPGTHGGFEATRTPGAPAWHELHTTRFAEAREFYENVFEWSVKLLADSDQFRYATNESEELATAGILDISTRPGPARSEWITYFAVADADAAADRVVELGGTILEPPVDSPHGRVSHALDATGARFTIIQESLA